MRDIDLPGPGDLYANDLRDDRVPDACGLYGEWVWAAEDDLDETDVRVCRGALRDTWTPPARRGAWDEG